MEEGIYLSLLEIFSIFPIFKSPLTIKSPLCNKVIDNSFFGFKKSKDNCKFESSIFCNEVVTFLLDETILYSSLFIDKNLLVVEMIIGSDGIMSAFSIISLPIFLIVIYVLVSVLTSSLLYEIWRPL